MFEIETMACKYKAKWKGKTYRFGAKGYTDYASGATKKQKRAWKKRHNSKSIPVQMGEVLLWTTPRVNKKGFKRKFPGALLKKC
jgi:hypothetical protein